MNAKMSQKIEMLQKEIKEKDEFQVAMSMDLPNEKFSQKRVAILKAQVVQQER